MWQMFNIGSRSSIPINIFIISMFHFVVSAKFYKNWAHCNLRLNLPNSRSTTSNIIFMANELDLLSFLNVITLGIYFIFVIKCFWNEVIDSCFNVGYVLFDHKF